jgi:hypothetical protein
MVGRAGMSDWTSRLRPVRDIEGPPKRGPSVYLDERYACQMPHLEYAIFFSDGRPSIEGFETLADAKQAGHSATEKGGHFKVVEADLSHESGTAQTREVFDSTLPDPDQ